MPENLKIDPYGFREYDARWLYEKDINKEGIENLGKGLGTQIKLHTKKNNPRVIVGHDYRSYSEEIKTSLKKGLISTGCNIEDIGLSLSPMVYFAQFNLDADAVAMVTASHNENGWTGVKMGIKKGLTHAPEEMKELKDITLNQKFSTGEGNEKQIKKVAEKCIFETYGSFDWYTSFQRLRSKGQKEEPIIARQGDYPDGLLMIRAGFARQSITQGNGNRTISYLGAGQSFGLHPLYNAWKDPTASNLALGSSLNAVGYVDVVRVPASVLAEFVFPNIEPPEDNAQIRADKSLADDVLLEWAVDERFINGRQTMVIDLNSCVRCDDCVRACANSHDGNPRFRRHGKIVENWMVANACMHCADPVCMIGCPTGAIHRSVSGGTVVINDDTCIGCGTCANSCPYENISLVEVSDLEGNPLVDESTHKPIVKATKCDLCSDQLGGPACVRACPHDALQRVDFREFTTDTSE